MFPGSGEENRKLGLARGDLARLAASQCLNAMRAPRVMAIKRLNFGVRLCGTERMHDVSALCSRETYHPSYFQKRFEHSNLQEGVHQ